MRDESWYKKTLDGAAVEYIIRSPWAAVSCSQVQEASALKADDMIEDLMSDQTRLKWGADDGTSPELHESGGEVPPMMPLSQNQALHDTYSSWSPVVLQQIFGNNERLA